MLSVVLRAECGQRRPPGWLRIYPRGERLGNGLSREVSHKLRPSWGAAPIHRRTQVNQRKDIETRVGPDQASLPLRAAWPAAPVWSSTTSSEWQSLLRGCRRRAGSARSVLGREEQTHIPTNNNANECMGSLSTPRPRHIQPAPQWSHSPIPTGISGAAPARWSSGCCCPPGPSSSTRCAPSAS